MARVGPLVAQLSLLKLRLVGPSTNPQDLKSESCATCYALPGMYSPEDCNSRSSSFGLVRPWGRYSQSERYPFTIRSRRAREDENRPFGSSFCLIARKRSRLGYMAANASGFRTASLAR